MSEHASNPNVVDKFKLIHWLNIRKTTVDVLNNLLSNKINKKVSTKDFENLDLYTAKEISNILSIPVSNILKQEDVPSFIYSSKKDIEKTIRPITRDGIHFYNYYTLPSPKGYVAPVLIDILCPKNKLPKLRHLII